MREISEYKLLAYYLIILNEKAGVNSIKYEQVKALTENICKRLTSKYNLLGISNKTDIVKLMISKGMFKVNNINGKTTISQVYNYEIMKDVYAYYTYDGTLLFKLPPQLCEKEDILAKIKKTYYNSIDLDLMSSINAVLDSYIKTNLKSASKMAVQTRKC